MKHEYGYLMESDEEALRLDIKTVPALVEAQARWAGIEPGMRVADLGCGAGKTTSIPGATSTKAPKFAQRVTLPRILSPA